jgi:hypothetical protein
MALCVGYKLNKIIFSILDFFIENLLAPNCKIFERYVYQNKN